MRVTEVRARWRAIVEVYVQQWTVWWTNDDEEPFSLCISFRVLLLFYLLLYIRVHTYHSRFIPKGVAEASQIFFRDAHVLPKLFSYE
jgi:hypothetical protein